MNKTNFKTKVIGTLLFVAFAFGATFMTYSTIASAQLVSQGSKINATGMISMIDTEAQSFVFQGAATGTVTVYVTENTYFGSGLTGLEDLSAGDTIQLVDQKVGDINYALRIREIASGAGYGVGPTPVSLSKALVVSTSENLLTVSVGGTNVVLTITPETEFVGTTLPELVAGDQVKVTGTDTGTEYDAEVITLL
jgi:hypothetical protein